MASNDTDLSFPEHFDVALSFAGKQRDLAEQLATRLHVAGISVFYDNFYPAALWGKDLPVFFDEIYRRRSRYCVIFVSQAYIDGLWTNHERQSAVARGLQERGEYILPIKVEAVELPGVPPTIGYLSLAQYPIDRIASILIEKLHPERSLPSTKVPAPQSPSPQPTFSQCAHESLQSQGMAGLIIGTVPEGEARLAEQAREATLAWFHNLEPDSVVKSATRDAAWSIVEVEQNAYAGWVGWLYPGPVLSLRHRVPLESVPEGSAMSFPALVSYWARILAGVPPLLRQLQVGTVSLAFTLHPYPPDHPAIVDLTFDAAPRPYKGAPAHQIAPWSETIGPFQVSQITPTLLLEIVPSLLDTFSYWKLQPLLAWLERAIDTGLVGGDAWLDRVLQVLATEQAKGEANQFTGVESWYLLQLVDVEQGTEEMFAIQDVLGRLIATGLVEQKTDESLTLTPEGWLHARGSVPGADRDLPFLAELVAAYRDPAASKLQDLVHATLVFGRLGWPLDAMQLANIAQRLLRAGLVEGQLVIGDALLRPTFKGLGAIGESLPTSSS